jgi:hypothetical protein
MRLLRITTSAFSSTSFPRIVTTRAPRSTALPSGVSRRARSVIFVSAGWYPRGFAAGPGVVTGGVPVRAVSGRWPAPSPPAAPVVSPRARRACSSESSTCRARSRSYTKCELPIDQCTRRPSPLHAGNCPPTSVSLRAGNSDDDASASDTAGASPANGTGTT